MQFFCNIKLSRRKKQLALYVIFLMDIIQIF